MAGIIGKRCWKVWAALVTLPLHLWTLMDSTNCHSYEQTVYFDQEKTIALWSLLKTFHKYRKEVLKSVKVWTTLVTLLHLWTLMDSQTTTHIYEQTVKAWATLAFYWLLFLHDSTLFVIDVNQNMFISCFPIPLVRPHLLSSNLQTSSWPRPVIVLYCMQKFCSKCSLWDRTCLCQKEYIIYKQWLWS